jgi:hypothetical protein
MPADLELAAAICAAPDAVDADIKDVHAGPPEIEDDNLRRSPPSGPAAQAGHPAARIHAPGKGKPAPQRRPRSVNTAIMAESLTTEQIADYALPVDRRVRCG